MAPKSREHLPKWVVLITCPKLDTNPRDFTCRVGVTLENVNAYSPDILRRPSRTSKITCPYGAPQCRFRAEFAAPPQFKIDVSKPGY
jgi:hypothetical protein